MNPAYGPVSLRSYCTHPEVRERSPSQRLEQAANVALNEGNPLVSHLYFRPPNAEAIASIPVYHQQPVADLGLGQSPSNTMLLAAAAARKKATDAAISNYYLEQAMAQRRLLDQAKELSLQAQCLRQAIESGHHRQQQQQLFRAAASTTTATPPCTPLLEEDAINRQVATSSQMIAPFIPPHSFLDKTFPSERSSIKMDLKGALESPSVALKVFETLGKTLRGKADPFVDVSYIPDPCTGGSLGEFKREKRRGASVFFPEVLYRMLQDVQVAGLEGVISFLPHGRAFRVYNKQEFVDKLLPRYFTGQTKWSSFSRQLNIYGFLRITTGPDYGAYYNELFLQGRPELTRFLRRAGAPHGVDRRTFKLSEGQDPDFYNMSAMDQVLKMKMTSTTAPTTSTSK